MTYISKMFTLNWGDVAKGVVMAVLGGILTAVYQALVAGMAIDLRSALTVGTIAGLSYIIKNFFSDSQGQFLGRIG